MTTPQPAPSDTPRDTALDDETLDDETARRYAAVRLSLAGNPAWAALVRSLEHDPDYRRWMRAFERPPVS